MARQGGPRAAARPPPVGPLHPVDNDDDYHADATNRLLDALTRVSQTEKRWLKVQFPASTTPRQLQALWPQSRFPAHLTNLKQRRDEAHPTHHYFSPQERVSLFRAAARKQAKHGEYGTMVLEIKNGRPSLSPASLGRYHEFSWSSVYQLTETEYKALIPVLSQAPTLQSLQAVPAADPLRAPAFRRLGGGPKAHSLSSGFYLADAALFGASDDDTGTQIIVPAPRTDKKCTVLVNDTRGVTTALALPPYATLKALSIARQGDIDFVEVFVRNQPDNVYHSNAWSGRDKTIGQLLSGVLTQANFPWDDEEVVIFIQLRGREFGQPWISPLDDITTHKVWGDKRTRTAHYWITYDMVRHWCQDHPEPPITGLSAALTAVRHPMARVVGNVNTATANTVFCLVRDYGASTAFRNLPAGTVVQLDLTNATEPVLRVQTNDGCYRWPCAAAVQHYSAHRQSLTEKVRDVVQRDLFHTPIVPTDLFVLFSVADVVSPLPRAKFEIGYPGPAYLPFDGWVDDTHIMDLFQTSICMFARLQATNKFAIYNAQEMPNHDSGFRSFLSAEFGLKTFDGEGTLALMLATYKPKVSDLMSGIVEERATQGLNNLFLRTWQKCTG